MSPPETLRWWLNHSPKDREAEMATWLPALRARYAAYLSELQDAGAQPEDAERHAFERALEEDVLRREREVLDAASVSRDPWSKRVAK